MRTTTTGNSLLASALAGVMATGPMTLVMQALFERLPASEKYPLPPSILTKKAESAIGVRDDVTTDQHLALTMVSHFGYGGAAGSLYGPLAERIPGPSLLKGALFGIGVWAGSYLGWLPAAGLLAPATRHPKERVALMIASHVVWGGVLGWFYERLSRPGPRLEAFR